MKDREPIPLVDVVRSGVVECRHRGSAAIIAGGNLADFLGDPYTVTPMRSTAKPFQILALLENGGDEYYALTAQEIAVMVSSHNGEKPHIQTVQTILGKAGLGELTLHCGIHPAYFPHITEQVFRETGSDVRSIHNNCSGKHAGMLLLCKMRELSLDDYWKPEHAVQQIILEKMAGLLETRVQFISQGVDGCGVPTYNINLTDLARLYYRLSIASPVDVSDKLGLVQHAMMTEPFMVAGSDRLDTDLMRIGPFIAKVGSQGIYCVGVPAKQLAIAIKIESGSEEAGECSAVALLQKMGLLEDEELNVLEKYWHRPVITCTGVVVGRYQAVF